MFSKVTEQKQKLAQMAAGRSTWEGHWQELVDYLLFFFQDIVTQGTPGAKRGSLICDITGTLAAIDCANGLFGTHTNPGLPWFAVKTENDALMENGEVKTWLQWLERQYYNLFNRSNFYGKIHEVYLALVGMCTGPLFIGEHFTNLAYFEPLNLGECYLAANQYGEINTLYRVFDMTPLQMQEKWGYNRLSEKVQKAISDKKITEKFAVVHAVEPRPNRDPERLDNRGFAFASLYFEKEAEDQVLEDGGYREFPFCVPRFFTAPGEIYGRGPGMVALPEIKELQQMEMDYSQGTQLRLRPPLILPNDGFMGPMNLTPFGLNYYRSDGNPAQDRIGTIPVGGDLRYADKRAETKQNLIRRIFFNQLFEAMQDPRATLGQVILNNQKDMQRLAPFAGKMQAELFNPMFDRLFALMVRRFTPFWKSGELPPPPAVLAGQNLRIDYISPLAKAQRQAEGQGIVQTLETAKSMMEIRPEVGDNIRWDETFRHAADLNSFPQKLLSDPKEMEADRKARAQQMQQQQAAAEMGAMADKIPAMSQEPGKGSPLELLMQMGRENPQ